MENWQIVTGSVFGVIAILLGVYVSFTVRQKGPILSNTYIWLSKEERKNVDKKAEYHLVSVVFGLLCLTALCEMIYIFTLNTVVMFIGIGLLLVNMLYAIVDSVRRYNG